MDSISHKKLGSIYLYFSDKDLNKIHKKNRETTISIFLISFVLLFFFTILIKREFRELKNLSKQVINYNPKLNNLKLQYSSRNDEVGIIHNAIVSMLKKIDSYSKELDNINTSLESKVQKRTKELQDANQKLQKLAITDPLTKLYNRRYFEKHLKSIWDIAKRKKINLSIIMCDIDFFKKVNDDYGHIAGDIVLQNISKIMKNALKRNSDFVARYGGEEFIIVMYDTNMKNALDICNSLRNDINSVENFKSQDIKIRHITLSFGISTTIPSTNNSSEELIKSADLALYEAKDNGRDCIITNNI